MSTQSLIPYYLLSLILAIYVAPSVAMNPVSYGLEPVAKKAKEEVDACTQFMDAAIHGKKSRFYNDKYKPKYYHNGEYEGITELHRALIAGDEQDCVNLLASGHDWRKPLFNGPTYLHIAAQEGFDSFCKFMLLSGFDVNTTLSTAPHTALIFAAERGKHSTCKLLLEHGASPISLARDFRWVIFSHIAHYSTNQSFFDNDPLRENNKLLKNICKSMASTPPDCLYHPEQTSHSIVYFFSQELNRTPQGKKHFYTLMPRFLDLGFDLYAEHCIPWQESFLSVLLFHHMNTIDQVMSAMVHCIVAYQAAKEAQHIRAIKTMLLIHKCRPNSLPARVPKDVLKSCIFKQLAPFHLKNVQESVERQLNIFRELLASYSTPEIIEGIRSHFPDQTNADEVINFLNPDNVNQFKPQLTQLTRLLMDLPAQES